MRALIGIGFLVSAVTFATAAEIFTTPQQGLWSARGVYLWPGPTALADFPSAGRQLRVVAPDGKTVLYIDDIGGHLLVANGKQSARFPVRSLTEVLWAANATAFTLTESDGGWVGSWSVRLVQLSPSGELRFHQIGRSVRKDFYARISKRDCLEYANLGAIAWIKGTEELLLVAEAPPHSSCPVMTAVCGYVVAVPSGAIRRRVGSRALKKGWGNALGSRLYRLQETNNSVAPGGEDEPIQIDCDETLPRRE
jgi:hypothetical protein